MEQGVLRLKVPIVQHTFLSEPANDVVLLALVSFQEQALGLLEQLRVYVIG